MLGALSNNMHGPRGNRIHHGIFNAIFNVLFCILFVFFVSLPRGFHICSTETMNEKILIETISR